jgi:hypothetical protein
MSATAIINKLLLSPIPQVRDLAKTTRYYLDQYEAGKINKSEFDELMADLGRLDGIHEDMVAVEVWREINTAVQTLMNIKNIITIL